MSQTTCQKQYVINNSRLDCSVDWCLSLRHSYSKYCGAHEHYKNRFGNLEPKFECLCCGYIYIMKPRNRPAGGMRLQLCQNCEKFKSLISLRMASKYSLTGPQLLSMHMSQNFKCKICFCYESITKSGSPKELCLDHDHMCCKGEFSCGKCIRGLVCHSCNMAIGYIEKSKINGSDIDKYLEQWKEKQNETNQAINQDKNYLLV